MKNILEHSSETWLFINGEVYIINYQISLFDFFQFLNHIKPGLISEYNQIILTKEISKTTFLKHLDRIEFVTIVGGG